MENDKENTPDWSMVKNKWSLVSKIITATTLFWFAETLYFIIMYGWHFNAVNQYEKTCDNIVTILILVLFTLATNVCYYVIDDYLKDK